MVLLWFKGLEDHVNNIVSPPKGDTPKSEKLLTLTQLIEDIADEFISAISFSGTIMYGKNNSNLSNSKSSKDVKYNYYKKNSHKESDYFQKHLEKLKEYKFNSGSYSTCSDLHPMKTSNGFALIVGIGIIILETTHLDGSSFLLTLTNVQYILTFPVNIFRALRLLVQNNDACVTSSGIFNKNNIEYSVVITSSASIYLRLAFIPTVLISAFLACQTIPSLDIIHQRLAYTSLEVVKNTIKVTFSINAELVKKASDEDPFLYKAYECSYSEKVHTSYITFIEGNLRLEELVVKAQDAEAVAEANSSHSPLSPPSTPQDAALPPQLNFMFEEVVQPTEEEEEVSEDKLPQVVVLTKRSHGRPKGSKNKKLEQGHTNSDITHVDLTENRITCLQAAKSSTQALSPVVSPSPVISGAFPNEEEILGQPSTVVMAYSHCLTAHSALNLGYALVVTDDPTEPKSYKETLDTPYSKE
ncbi:hypothetical protein B7463_g3821, partial [Scytalidium lignicola]